MARGRRRKHKYSQKFIFTVFVIILIIAIAIGIFYFAFPDKFKEVYIKLFGVEDGGGNGGNGFPASSSFTLTETDLSIHFLQLESPGDCTLVKVGDTEVLIDAGSKTGSIDTICNYIDNYCVDDIIEYVIVTHAHEDHYACFAGSTSSSYQTIFDRYECEIIIDFPLSENINKSTPTKMFERYIAERDAEVANGAIRYSALDCYNNQNGANRIYQLGDGVTLEILYNYYYENDAVSDNENDYSVCCLIRDGDKEFLFTGDLEEHGEEKLVESGQLSKVDVYKAGHHGSYTASTDIFLEVIDPDIVIFTSVLGSDEYSDNIDNMYPAKRVCDSLKNYTDSLYITGYNNEETGQIEAYNGNIVIISNESGLNVYCSDKTDTMVASSWYQAHRA